MITERTDFFAKLAIKISITHIFTTAAKERANQKTYTDHWVNGEASLGKLMDNLKVESLAQSGWTSILNVMTAIGKILNILYHIAIITKKEMELARKHQMISQYINSKNLYIATWRLITSKPKRSMAEHNEQVQSDGLSFLYYLLRNYA